MKGSNGDLEPLLRFDQQDLSLRRAADSSKLGTESALGLGDLPMPNLELSLSNR